MFLGPIYRVFGKCSINSLKVNFQCLGYASFVEFLCVNYLFPDYHIWTQFVNDSYIKALELDR